ncbi:hypothetical protein EMIHUDRAFT_105441 [Emiliania huxleyi CCMP1516]|uniref:Acyltransferase 3 domain-containing protein n=2 Tax=Emiliania huxleyi TaxID=2903 RepID=A0A0D3IFL0_EMIH1|nr:hypothetical protein EMIHUDRAFT_105441 [Emiliania huxleyi CCMP1516]EOD10045.1 hypothetical protein EMIHUDRAFT_105441 [Emiliania huxleyi CCMP1516]|eukprot:XP_005762474.1 hypothetical protein EMIHUDRAFT_105441 [Emiliania huxleyi CCMP1516]
MNRTVPAAPFAAIAGVAALLAYVRARLRRGHRREDARLEDGAGRNSFDNSLPSRLEILAHYWSCPRLTLRAPVGALKGWVLATLWLELALFTAPELCVLAVPEVVELYSGVLPYRQDKPDLPHLVEWLLPGMASASVHGSTSMGDWMGGPPSPLVASRVTWLRCVRQALLVGWILFLLIPLSDWPRAATAAFATGAAAYFLLGTIGLLYDPCHNIQADAPNIRDRGHCALSASLLFVVVAAFAVPDLASNPRSAAWLRHTSLVAVLVPVYLFSGISKVRYSGDWLLAVRGDKYGLGDEKVVRAPLAEVSLYIARSPWLCMLFSWGNLLVELALPVALLYLLARRERGWRLRVVLPLFVFGAFGFHASILLLMGPNFLRMFPLLVLAH